MFPKFLLKRLYQKKSLRLTDTGFSFVVQNRIASGHVIEVHHLKFNEVDIPFDQITVSAEGKELTADQITPEEPVALTKGEETFFSVHYLEAKSAEGTSPKIVMKFTVRSSSKEMTLEFDFTDELKPAE